MLNTVPRAISAAIEGFCLPIAPSRPSFIRSKPSASAEPSAYFDNVSRKIERAGGSMVHGWAIWTVPGVCFEAEHHGAWRRRGGEVIDVSPQLNNARRILFLPDSEATFDPLVHRSNIIRPVEGNPLAAEFVELANRRNAIRVRLLRLWSQLID